MNAQADDHADFEAWENELQLQTAYATWLERQGDSGDWMCFVVQMNPKAVVSLYETAVRFSHGNEGGLDYARMNAFYTAMEQTWADAFVNGTYHLHPRKDYP